jgi:hypothetical protein
MNLQESDFISDKISKNRILLRLKKQIAFTLTCFVSIFLFSCGPSIADQVKAKIDEEQKAKKRDCPQKSKYKKGGYLLEKGEGQSIEEAHQRAQAEISRFISSEIQSLVIAKAKQSSSTQRTEDDIQEEIRLSSRFEHAELIKSIEGCELCENGKCTVYAYLSTDEASKRIKEGIQNDLSRLLKATEDLTENTHITRFSQAWQDAHASYERIRPILNQIEVLGAFTPELSNAKTKMEKAYQLKENRKAKLSMKVEELILEKFQGQGLDQALITDQVNSSLQSALGQSLNQAGLKRWEKGACPNEGEKADVLVLTPRGDLLCSLGVVGPQCILKLRANLSICGQLGQQTDIGEVDWSQTPLNGVHSNDYQFAIQRLLKGLSEGKVSGPLIKSLSTIVTL